MPKKPKLHSLGVFKLKDKQNRSAVMLDFNKIPAEKIDRIFITKVFGENNKIDIKVAWRENDKQVSLQSGYLQSGA